MAPDGLGGWKGDTGIADGGGILFDLGTHLIDQALQLFGPVTEVLADVNRRDPRAGCDADDDTVMILRHARGTSSRLTMSSVAALPGPRFRVLGSRNGYVKHGLDGQEAALKAGMSPPTRRSDGSPRSAGPVGPRPRDGTRRARARGLLVRRAHRRAR
ncbi:Gfo/Idh/MocA family oxidoreductase [Nonomuraea sp. JJY05]|uniref:Gfo/Idh/MocA family protein n=1 Tax=Nonomuraea sp. JJY05 TaxID=3350255 RepID=UPI00373F57F3